MKKSFTDIQVIVAIIFVISTAVSFGVYVRSEERNYNKEVNDIKAEIGIIKEKVTSIEKSQQNTNKNVESILDLVKIQMSKDRYSKLMYSDPSETYESSN